jgi:lysozyme
MTEEKDVMAVIRKKLSLSALVGTGAAALLYVMIPRYEGEVLRGYRDPIGIATKCYGDTEDVVVGKAYSRADCLRSLESALLKHAGPVMECVPQLADYSDGEKAAAVSLAYNIGVNAFCKSTIARNFRAGDRRGACAGFPAWNRAGGKVLKGLVIRRADEAAICARDIPEVTP